MLHIRPLLTTALTAGALLGTATFAQEDVTLGLAVANLQADFFNQIRQSVEAEAAAQGVQVVTVDARGDAAARLIAETGKTWAEKVLRREDMLLYVWRLLLEFARVSDEKRDKLGFIADMVTGETGIRPWRA